MSTPAPMDPPAQSADSPAAPRTDSPEPVRPRRANGPFSRQNLVATITTGYVPLLCPPPWSCCRCCGW